MQSPSKASLTHPMHHVLVKDERHIVSVCFSTVITEHSLEDGTVGVEDKLLQSLNLNDSISKGNFPSVRSL